MYLMIFKAFFEDFEEDFRRGVFFSGFPRK